MSESPVRRTRMSRWTDRATVIALGVSLGLGAKWVVQTWQSATAADPVKVTAPSSTTSPPVVRQEKETGERE